ncbi:MAG: SGNH/GDSL hydrolase family protein [Lachnospiraceae bacterium]|nr:SGNH/GDSL hydrolase family protein [Lachnospiraceae bacterium]
MAANEKKKKHKVLKIVISVLLILVVVVGAGGYVAYRIFGSKVLTVYLGTKPGNKTEYAPENAEVHADSPLQGKTIIFLGSSVTEGYGACGTSFVQYLEAQDGIIPVEEAVGGTTLVDNGDTSYIPRMETIDTTIQADAFICQLSTNDATKGLPVGEVSDSFDREDFDTSTIAGAIEYIISYASDTWTCPVIFYTGSKYDSDAYDEMVELLLQIQDKWNIGVIDMWDDEAFNNITSADRELYMLDGIHPTKAGYRDWWTPYMREYLIDYLSE